MRNAIQIRRWLSSSQRRYNGFHWLAFLLGGAALATLLAGRFMLAVGLGVPPLAWALIVGAIPVPRSRHAYLNGATEILRDWAHLSRLHSHAIRKAAVDANQKLESLPVPDPLAGLHRQWAEGFRLYLDSASDRSIPLGRRAADAIDRRRSLRAAIDDIDISTLIPSEGAYLQSLEEIRGHARDKEQRENNLMLHEAETALRSLQSLTAPDEEIEGQKLLVEAMRGYVVALRQLLVASNGDDPRAAESAGLELTRSSASLREQMNALWSDLHEQWGAPPLPSQDERVTAGD
jgi:hypothetical protein